jgi:hypothetical protein
VGEPDLRGFESIGQFAVSPESFLKAQYRSGPAVQRWKGRTARRPAFAGLTGWVKDVGELDAETIEPAFASAGHVIVSNARTHRMDPLVPLVIPEVNPDHLGLLPAQRRERGWRGVIVTNPNCSTVFLTMALAALREFHPLMSCGVSRRSTGWPT